MRRSILPTARVASAGSAPVRPQLTSLVDMMTILLVFLLKSFSVEGEFASAAADVTLPTSTSRDRAVPEISVELGRSVLAVDGRVILDLTTLTERSDPEIPELREALQAAVGPDAGSRPVAIQCDRDHEFRTLKRVMHTCSASGFADFSLLVLREESS